jgi:hypothetical protein
MKRNLLLLIVLVFVLGSVPAVAQTVKRPFNGTDLTGWKFNGGQENCWKVGLVRPIATTATTLEIATPGQGQGQRQGGQGQGPRQGQGQGPRQGQGQAQGPRTCMVNTTPGNWTQEPRKGVDVYTEEKFGDCTVKVDVLIPRNSNSGVYLMGEYEVQVNDSFAKPSGYQLTQGDMGAIYSSAAPKINATGQPGTWQTYEIEFVAPKFDAAGKKTANAVFKKITLNGYVVQENVEVQGPTGGGITGVEAATGPLMFQGNHGPVAFRNIQIIVP